MRPPMTKSPSDLLTCEEISRRRLLTWSGAFAASALIPAVPSLASSRDPRFLFVILRGALDGLSAVMPVGDPEFQRLRGGFLEDIAKAGEPLKLDGFFSLNPVMKSLSALYAKKEALVVHAAATPYRDRSHFDGQEILESGLPKAIHPDTGWLNRLVGHIGGKQKVEGRRRERGISIGTFVPLVMRGPAPVLSWSPQHLPQASEDTVNRLLALYEARDPMLAEALRMGMALDKDTRAMDTQMQGRNQGPQAVLAMVEGAARLLSKPDGPRIGALSIDGWDTHAGQGPGTGRLGKLLGTLDEVFLGLERGLGAVWKDTAIAIVTEFGRTVRINGTAGTDHGTATVAFLLGGAVKGGRIIADWPSLSANALHEGRDLKPTTDLRAVLKGVLTSHLGIDANFAGTSMFPESVAVKPLAGLTA
ncbi:MAG: DUF1501 domain-containing protein [Hyphomicrobiaceae bacterium]|nr:MAG: DUF1501 domain-containing protein [Hyphomicrobiaceae bacterium]